MFLREDINNNFAYGVKKMFEELHKEGALEEPVKILNGDKEKTVKEIVEEKEDRIVSSDFLDILNFLQYFTGDSETWRSNSKGITINKTGEEYKIEFDKPIKELIIKPSEKENVEFEKKIDNIKTATIVAIIGCSSSGKDSVLKEMLSKNPKSLKGLVSHTTRPMREGEKNGNEYYFVSEESFINGLEAGEFIEYRTYDIANGETWYYGLHESEIDFESNNIYVGIFDVNGYWSLVDEFGKESVFPVYIECDVVTRLQRALEREDIALGTEKYREVLRRLYADSEEIEQYKDDFNTIFYNGDSSKEDFEDKVDCLVNSIIEFHESK